MNHKKIFINGKQVNVTEDQTILEACKLQGIEIPTLCHDGQLEPFSSCFLCVVEVEGSSRLIPSCSTKVSEGMKITTSNKNISEARKMALELMLSNHYADCLGPCKITCPAGVDVQGYLSLAATGHYYEAIELIKKNNPLPTVCGRVCTRPCEMNCRRNLIDEPAAIDHVKRFIADVDLDSPDRYFPEVKPDNGKKVAIVGAGPAGLSCAYYLRQEGYEVDIFDAKPKAGGMLRWGIPQYRLPEHIIDKEIEGVTRLGVKIHLNKALGRDFSLDSLLENSYKAVFLGLGAQSSSSMRVENEDAEGVLAGIDFLEDVKLGKITELKGKVAVIGGGNTAMDAARTALRLGADEVTIVYRRTMKEMPANQLEIEEAEEEGVKFVLLTAPLKVVLDENQRAEGLECVKMELGEPDASGRRRPVPIEGSNYIIGIDWAIAAIGQKPDLAFAAKDSKLVNVAQSKWGTLEVKADIMETNIPGVFAGGDVVLGPATAVEAIADGRKAAESIHKYLSGEKLEIVKKPFISRRDNFKNLSPDDFSGFAKTTRQKMAVRNPEQRKKDWEEIELGFSKEQVYQEAIRCLSCGCQAFYDCDLQKHSTEYEANQKNYLGEFHDEIPDTSHPFIHIELNKCILCGRCVRICDEVVGLGIFGFIQRGYEAKVKPVLEMPLAETACISCGLCVETCPTGAIADRADTLQPGPWILEQKSSVCQFCSVGCELNADVLENRILKISAKPDSEVNPYGNLCAKGRYGFRYLNSPERIKTPYLRRNGELKPVSWEEALNFTAQKIRESEKGNWAVFGSAHSSTEELFLLQKFARSVLNTENINSFSIESEQNKPVIKLTTSSARFADIKKSDLIFVLGFDPMETHPVVYFELQKAAREKQNVLILGEPESRLAIKSGDPDIPKEKLKLFFKLIISSLTETEDAKKTKFSDAEKNLIASIAGITETDLTNFNVSSKNFDQFLISIKTAESPLFVLNRDSGDVELFNLIHLLEKILKKEKSVLSLSESINLQGMLDMGFYNSFSPGYQSVPERGLSTSDALKKVLEGEIKNSIFWGQDTLASSAIIAKRPENSFMIVADLFLTETAKAADVVFPIVPFFETDGSVTNAEGRIEIFKAAVKSATSHSNLDILTGLANLLGQKWTFRSAEEVRAEIGKVIPMYQNEFVQWDRQVLKERELPALVHSKTEADSLENWYKREIQSRISFSQPYLLEEPV